MPFGRPHEAYAKSGIYTRTSSRSSSPTSSSYSRGLTSLAPSAGGVGSQKT